MLTWLEMWQEQELPDTPFPEGRPRPAALPNCPYCQKNSWEILRTVAVTDRIPYHLPNRVLNMMPSGMNVDGLTVQMAYVQCQHCLEKVGHLNTDELRNIFIWESTVRKFLVNQGLMTSVDDDFGFAIATLHVGDK